MPRDTGKKKGCFSAHGTKRASDIGVKKTGKRHTGKPKRK